MLSPTVVDPVAHRVPLDAFAIAAYTVAFALVAGLTARRPAYGIAALVAFVPFAFAHDVGPTTLSLSKVALGGAVAGLLLRRSGLSVLRDRAAATFLVCGVFVIAATALSMWHALYRGAALRETLKSVEYLVLFATVAVAARADADERPVRVVLAASVAAVSLLALRQEFTGAPSGLWFMNHVVPRIAGPLEGPNQLAGYLGIALPLVTAFICTRRRANLEIGVLAVGCATLVLTISRAGVVASLGAIVLCVVLAPPSTRNVVAKPLALALGAGCAAGGAFLAFWGYAAAHSLGAFTLFGRFWTMAEAPNPGAVGTRSELWRAAWILWRQHPFFGIGAGNFEFELPLAGYPQLRTHANSLYVQSLVEGGVPLFLATLALVGASIARFARGPFREPFVLGAFAASVGFAAHQLFDLLVFYPKVGELWWIVLALGAARSDALAPVVAASRRSIAVSSRSAAVTQ